MKVFPSHTHCVYEGERNRVREKRGKKQYGIRTVQIVCYGVKKVFVTKVVPQL